MGKGLLPAPQTEVEVEVDFDGEAVRADPSKKEGRGATVIAHLRGRGDVTISTDAIMALTRDDGPV
jgi:hypothetical protein